MCTSPLPFHRSGASDLDFLQKKLVKKKKEVEAYWLVRMCSLSSCSLHSCSWGTKYLSANVSVNVCVRCRNNKE